MKDYNTYQNEEFNNITPIEKKQEIIDKSNAIIEKMKEYIGKKITVYYQCSGGGFWELKEFKKIEFKQHNFDDGITILDCYIYGIPKKCKKIYRNRCSYWNFAIFDGWHNDYKLPYYQNGWQTLKTKDMKEFIKKNKKDLIIDNTPELVKSKIHNEDIGRPILSWQDKSKIGKRVNEEKGV